MNDHLYMIFKSMTHVLSAERAARANGVSCRMVPIPRNLSTDCGMCISVREEDKSAFLEAVEQKGFSPERIEAHKTSGPGGRCYSN